MNTIQDEDISDLFILEDDALNYHVPHYNAILSAYSKSFMENSITKNTIMQIEESSQTV